MSSNILVLGGTGKTGKRVVNRLNALNIHPRVGSRNASLSFDWENADNWQEVLAGVQKLYITFQPDLAVPGSAEKIAHLVALSKPAGVQKLVLLSGRGEKEAEICEQIVINSGLDHTIVRASWFMQNFSENFLLDSVMAGEVILPVIKAREPFIDIDDIADIVVAALTEEKHTNKLYEVTGPELLSFKKAVSHISNALNRPVTLIDVSMDEYVSMLREYQLPEDHIWLITYLFSEVLDGRNESITNDVERALGRKATGFEEYVNKTIKSGVWEIQGVLK